MIRKLDHEEIASLLAYGYETDSTCGSPRFKRGDHVKCKKGDGAGVVSKIYHYWPRWLYLLEITLNGDAFYCFDSEVQLAVEETLITEAMKGKEQCLNPVTTS